MKKCPWPLKRFGDLYVIPSRNGITRPGAVRGSGYKMINMGELFAYPRLFDPDMERVKLNEDEKDKFNVLPLDLLFARQSLVAEGAGKCCIALKVEEFTTFESHLIRVRLDPSQCDPLFYFYFFSSGTGFGAIQTLVNQVSAAGIRGSDLAKLKVLYPPLEVQRKAAAILAAQDELIENNQRRIELLEKMAEEIYREWFVRLRFPGYEKVHFVKGVPDGWRVRQFHEIVEYYIGGGWGEDNQSTSFSEAAYVIRGTDIPDIQAGKFEGCPYRFHKPSNLKSRTLQSGDFVFEVSGGSKDQLLGRNVFITEHLLKFFNVPVIAASFCKQIRFRRELVSPYFMKYFMKLYYDCDLVGIFQIQSTGISNYQFESFLKFQTIILPPDELQNKFEDIVKPIIEMRDSISLANIELRKTRNLLLPRLISGELSIDKLGIQYPPGMMEALKAGPAIHA